MRIKKKIAIVLATVALIGILVEVWSATMPIRGRIAARLDIRDGHYRLLTYGLPPPWLPDFNRFLKHRYGIEVSAVAGCILSSNMRSYVDSYDQVSVAAANQRFGHDVFKEAEHAVGGR